MKNKVIHIIILGFLLAVLLSGVVLITIPSFQAKEIDAQIEKTVEEWKSSYSPSVKAEPAAEPVVEIFPELLNAMIEFNREIFINGQSELVDALSYQSEVFDLSAYGLTENVVGLISIPKLELELPLLLGANSNNLSLGFAQLSQTSMPIGGNNTNCVVACHRGYRGAAFLRHADHLEVGDMIYLQNFWDNLTYKVCEIKVIEPFETDEILIQPGRDLLTLITCTPYRVGSHRLVIFCERTE